MAALVCDGRPIIAEEKQPTAVPRTTESPTEEDTGWQKIFREMAGSYEMGSTDDVPRKFSLRSAPVLRWNQPVRGGDDGAVYVWLDEGRPAVIGSIFAWPRPNGVRQVVHEMHALTETPLRAEYQDREVWLVEKPALEFMRMPEATAPAPLAAQRLAQMRTLSREFTATSIDRNKSEWELRLLANPLIRYEIKDRSQEEGQKERPIDGAIFSFVQGTDPEILLVLEARAGEGKSFWQYALARFSDLPLTVKRKDVKVWSVSTSTMNQSNAPYFVRDVEQRTLPDEKVAAEKPQAKTGN